jgi:CheY-like chemotaxis protein
MPISSVWAAAQARASAGRVSFTRPADALACAAAHTDEIGIVLTDYEMPGMDGLVEARHHDDRHVGEARQRPQAPDHREAVHARHLVTMMRS